MNNILNILLPVLGLGSFGYIATKLGHFSQSNREGLAKYVFDFAVPVLLFSAVVQLETPSKSTMHLLGAYYIPLLVAFTVALVISFLILKKHILESTIIGLGACFSNSVLLGIPLIPRALGEEALYPLLLIISVHGITIFSAVTIVVEITRGRHKGLKNLPHQIISGLITNPLIIGLLLGFMWKWTTLGLHPSIIDLFDLITTSVTPAALFVLGSSLASYSIIGSVETAILVTLIKNIMHPLMVFCFGTLFELNALWLSVAILLAAMPTGMNMYLFAIRYNIAPPTATTSIFLSTVVSILTVSVTLALI